MMKRERKTCTLQTLTNQLPTRGCRFASLTAGGSKSADSFTAVVLRHVMVKKNRSHLERNYTPHTCNNHTDRTDDFTARISCLLQ